MRGDSGTRPPTQTGSRYAHATHYMECEDYPCPRRSDSGATQLWVNLIPFQFDCAISLSIRLRTVIPHESGNPSSLAPQNMVTSQWIGMSTREPRLDSDLKFWRNYHYFNRAHLSHPGKGLTCPNGLRVDEFLGVGLATGRFVDGYYDNEVMVETYYYAPPSTTTRAHAVCKDFGTGIFVNDTSALTFKMYWTDEIGDSPEWIDGAWKIDIWLGYWKNLAMVPTSWDVAPVTEYGQEIWARYGDVSSVVAPLNFGHKANITDDNGRDGPWHEEFLSSGLRDRSGSNTDRPFSVTDLKGKDYTSIASCVPVDDKCE